MIGWLYGFKLISLTCYWFCLIFPVIFFIVLRLISNKYGKKAVLLCWLFLPLFSFVICNAAVWSGFHYRMELREHFGKDEQGNININRMPQEVRSEYDANGGNPRRKSCIGMLFLGWVVLPLYCLLLSPVYMIIRIFPILDRRLRNESNR